MYWAYTCIISHTHVGPILGVPITAHANMHYRCTGVHMHPGHALYYTALEFTCTRDMHYITLHWSTRATGTSITYSYEFSLPLCAILATLIFSGVFYLCLYPSFCPCPCRVCLDLGVCPYLCPCLSSVLYLCRESPCLDVCLYAGVVLYPCPCLFPYSLSHLVMRTYHLIQPQFYPHFPFFDNNIWKNKTITKRSIWPPFPYIHCKPGESDQKDFWELLLARGEDGVHTYILEAF